VIADRGWTRITPRSPVTWMPRSAAMVCWPIVVTWGAGMTDIEQHDSVQVFVGVDVGKGAHHAVALDRKGKRLLDSALPNDETKLRASRQCAASQAPADSPPTRLRHAPPQPEVHPPSPADPVPGVAARCWRPRCPRCPATVCSEPPSEFIDSGPRPPFLPDGLPISGDSRERAAIGISADNGFPSCGSSR